MADYWKEHTTLRLVLIAGGFLAGLVLLIGGWRLTGTLTGLGIMLAGVALLLAALWLYNIVFTDSKKPKSK